MPVATKKPESTAYPSHLPVGDVVKDREIYKTATADMAVMPPESLVLYMEGMPWSVDYYSQLLDAHDNVREIDVSANASLQQYSKLLGVELRVQSELSQDYDESTGRNNVTGSAIAIGFIPNHFDYFVTDVGTQGQGLFMVTSSTRKTYNNESVYEISYVLIGYTETDTAMDRYQALEARAVKKFHFHKERIEVGLPGFLTTNEHGTVKDLMKEYRSMAQNYIAYFISHSDRLLTVPDPEHLYDSRMAVFVASIIDHDMVPDIAGMNTNSHDRNPYLTLNSILTMILKRDIGQMKSVCKKVSRVPRAFFRQNSFMISTNCWAVESYVMPNISEANALFPHLARMPTTPTFANDENGYGKPISSSGINLISYAGKDIPAIHPVHKNDFYILSEAFYTQNKSEMSMLEILLTDYLNKVPLNLEHLNAVVRIYDGWNHIEKFYYTPILLVLLKDATAAYY